MLTSTRQPRSREPSMCRQGWLHQASRPVARSRNSPWGLATRSTLCPHQVSGLRGKLLATGKERIGGTTKRSYFSNHTSRQSMSEHPKRRTSSDLGCDICWEEAPREVFRMDPVRPVRLIDRSNDPKIRAHSISAHFIHPKESAEVRCAGDNNA